MLHNLDCKSRSNNRLTIGNSHSCIIDLNSHWSIVLCSINLYFRKVSRSEWVWQIFSRRQLDVQTNFVVLPKSGTTPHNFECGSHFSRGEGGGMLPIPYLEVLIRVPSAFSEERYVKQPRCPYSSLIVRCRTDTYSLLVSSWRSRVLYGCECKTLAIRTSVHLKLYSLKLPVVSVARGGTYKLTLKRSLWGWGFLHDSWLLLGNDTQCNWRCYCYFVPLAARTQVAYIGAHYTGLYFAVVCIYRCEARHSAFSAGFDCSHCYWS